MIILPLLLLAWLGGTGCQDRSVFQGDELRAVLRVPHFRNPLEARLVDTWKRRDLVFERVLFQGRYGDWIPALICYSELARFRPLPALLCMPGSSNSKEDLLQPVDLLPRWADKGFFTVSIDRPYHGEREGSLAAAVREKGLLQIWGENVYDLKRALDYLESREEVDEERIGMLGLSMGGMETLLLGALDRRVKVLVCVAGQLVWEEIFQGDHWSSIFQGLELRNELLRSGSSGPQALKAFQETYPGWEQIDASLVVLRIPPRPLLLMSGADDPFIPPAAARKVYQAALRKYPAGGQTERLELWIAPDTAHSFPPIMQERALAWFQRWL